MERYSFISRNDVVKYQFELEIEYLSALDNAGDSNSYSFG